MTELEVKTSSPSEQPPQGQRLKASDFHPDVLCLFDQYVHGLLDRRGFLERAAKFAVAGSSAVAILEALSPRFAQAQQIQASDPRLQTERIEVPSPLGYGKLSGYLAKPKKFTGKLPTLLVVHENRGLNPHIEDVTRRLALEQFIAFAPDALFPLGGYPGDEDKARELFTKLDQSKTREDFLAAAKFLQRYPEGNGRLGTVGFCYGGGIVHMLAARLPELDAAVPFYGMAPDVQSAANVKATLLVHFAEQDERVNSAWPPYEAALKAAHVKFDVFKYAGTQHGFNNDTTPRYDEKSAKLAWQRTLTLFNRVLRKPAPHSKPQSDNPY